MTTKEAAKHCLVLFCFFILSGLNLNAQETEKNHPNIIFIMADDFGYGSVNSYGADKEFVRTPNIDRIAEKGVRFTNAHAPASVCSPTRYGLLTGRYPWRSSMKYGVVDPFGPLLIDPARVTIADWLKDYGYNTAVVGKWHLGYGSNNPLDPTKKLTPGPLDLGFDYHFGVPQNHDDGWGVYVENDRVYGLKSDKVNPYSRNFYGGQYVGIDAPQRVNAEVMSMLTDKSVNWLKQQSGSTPFFLYFAAVAVHHPITPSEYMRGISGCGPYGDFIQDLDLSVGRIIEILEYMNLMDNTIVIFTSDNGGEIPGSRPEAPERQAIDFGFKINGNLKGDKHTIYEGGTRVPFIVSWPGMIKENTVSDNMINLVDVFATVCDITAGKMPESKEIAPDSRSFYSSLINSGSSSARNTMVTADANGFHAVRIDDWKYVDDTPPESLPEKRLEQWNKLYESGLYNLEEDLAEQNNLINDNPEMLEKLRKELERIRQAEATR